MRLIAFLAFLLLAACQVSVDGQGPQSGAVAPSVRGLPLPPAPVRQRFEAVVDRVAPVAVDVCRRRTRGRSCNFLILVDIRPGEPPNAFLTEDRRGRPVIGFTRALVEQARNADELAFVMGHEAAHHILGHIPQTQVQARQGAVLGAALAGAFGLDPASAEAVTQQGAALGARRFAKEFELEADALGTVIAAQAGFDPVRGAEFFARLPDPGDQFLGTHPPNADRVATVRRVAAGL